MALINNINTSSPNDDLGDAVRDAFNKVNTNLNELNNKKVEKESGFGLTENNFTDDERIKLAGIEAGAQVNVKANLDQEDPEADDYVLGRESLHGVFSAVGQLDYNDLATQSTPLSYTSGNLQITNDGLGAYSFKEQAPYGVTDVWDVSANTFNFGQLSVGDKVHLRIDLSLTTNVKNQVSKLMLLFGEGNSDESLENISNEITYKNSGEHNLIVDYTFDLRPNSWGQTPVKLLFNSTSSASIVVKGFNCFIVRKSINVLEVESDIENTDFLPQGDVNLYMTNTEKLKLESLENGTPFFNNLTYRNNVNDGLANFGGVSATEKEYFLIRTQNGLLYFVTNAINNEDFTNTIIDVNGLSERIDLGVQVLNVGSDLFPTDLKAWAVTANTEDLVNLDTYDFTFWRSGGDLLTDLETTKKYPTISDALSSNKNTTKIFLNQDVTEDVTGQEYNGRIEIHKGIHLDTNGVQRSTYAEPMDRFVFGKEYLWSVYDKQFLNRRNVLQAVFSGDSTTAGDYAQGFTPDVAFRDFADRKGVPVLTYNEGKSGSSSLGWNNTHVNNDITTYPNMDLYFVRWGINDGGRGATRLEDYKTALRSGLAKLRAFKGVDDLAIVLMTPNSTSDTLSTRDYTSNRDERWYEEMIPIIRQAARDFQCVFIDTYAIYRDSRNGAAGLWLDNPFNDGRGVHPDKAFNYNIYSFVADVVLKPLESKILSNNTFSNNVSSLQTVSATLVANDYHSGISVYRTGAGFPISGSVWTYRSADNIIMQKVYSFNTTAGNEIKNKIFTRFASTATNYVWSDWLETEKTLNIDADFSNYTANGYGGAVYRKNENGLVTINGALEKTGNANYGNLIATLPIGFHSQFKRDFNVITSTNGFGTTGSNLRVGAVRVWANGDITVVDCDRFIQLDNINFYTV